MKKNLLFLFVLCCGLHFQSLSQIIMNQNDMPEIGDVFITVNDTTHFTDLSKLGNSGENQTWDMTWISNYGLDTTTYVDPAVTPYFSQFPNATLCSTSNDLNYGYILVDANHAEMLGAIMLTDIGEVTLQMNQTIMNFPYTYLSESEDTVVLDKSMYYGQTISGFQVDSIRIKSTMYTHAIVDAWGNITTPHYNDDVLRVHSHTNNVDSLWGYVVFPIVGGSWMLYQATVDSSDTYSWYPNLMGAALAEIEVTHDTITNSSFLADPVILTEKASLANSELGVYPNPTTDYINLSHVDENSVVEIFDITGKSCYNKPVNNRSIFIGNLPDGLYVIRMNHDNKWSYGKFTILK